MIGLFTSVLVIIYFGLFFILPASKNYISIIGISFYTIILYNLFSPIFGISVVFILQIFYLLYFLFSVSLVKTFKMIIRLFKIREIKFLFIFVIFLFLNHLVLGSTYRHSLFSYTLIPIFQLICICLAIEHAIIQNISFFKILNYFRIICWFNILFGGYYLVIKGIEFHGNIEFSDNVGFNTNIFSMLCIQLVTFELFFLRKVSVFKIIILLIPIYLSLLTGSRSGLITLLLIILYWVTRLKNKSLFFLFSLFAIFIISYFDFSMITDRFFLISDNYNHSGTKNLLRYQLIMRGAYMFLDYPLFGTGIGTFHQFRHTWPELIPLSRSNSFIDSHNLYIQILSETGLFGAALFLLFFYFLIKSINNYKNSDIRTYIFLMSNIILYLSSGLFDHDFYRYYLLIPFLLAIIYSKYEMSLNSRNEG